MSARQQPKTADDMVRMRKGRNRAILGAIAGLAVLFFVLTIARMGGATG
jgi:phage shock protein PspC (stress-responsive transcriptional regulator)